MGNNKNISSKAPTKTPLQGEGGKMENIIEKLRNLCKLLEQEVYRREEVFDNRSEKWQDGQEGEEYNDVIGKLSMMLKEIDECIEHLQ